MANLNSADSNSFSFNFIGGLENLCSEFNNYFIVMFTYLKYGFVIFLFLLGILTLLKLRGVYFDKERPINKGENDMYKNIRLIVGFSYIFLGFGICFNFLTYMLIYLFDPLPDRLVFNFINFSRGIDPKYMNRIEDIDAALYPHELTIIYGFAMLSFTGFLHLMISIALLLHDRLNKKPRLVIMNFISSLTECVLFGFSTFMPFFLM